MSVATGVVLAIAALLAGAAALWFGARRAPRYRPAPLALAQERWVVIAGQLDPPTIVIPAATAVKLRFLLAEGSPAPVEIVADRGAFAGRVAPGRILTIDLAADEPGRLGFRVTGDGTLRGSILVESPPIRT
ncbi:MAG TPA: hypothetical protein VMS56_12270 [Thermoanaerobaculia bacterium]|nr:hypothetical protein [Thermoanaerobaculia bacterium]